MKTQEPLNQLISSFVAFFLAAFRLAGCAATGNNFAESKISQIKKEQTTESELIEMFGQLQKGTMRSKGMPLLKWMYIPATVKGETPLPRDHDDEYKGRSPREISMPAVRDAQLSGAKVNGGRV